MATSNPFSDGVLVSDSAPSDNPDATSVASGKGWYDWTLAKRMFLAFAALAAVYLLPTAYGSWQLFRRANVNYDKPVIQQVIDVATDWNRQKR
jgi:hypothetical protein